MRLFSLAEVQLFQFEDVPKALESYQQLLTEYADSEYGAKAAYAIGYIYEVKLKDQGKSTEAYMYLINKYPDTQQADYARDALGMPPAERDPVVPPAPADSTGTAGQEETGT